VEKRKRTRKKKRKEVIARAGGRTKGKGRGEDSPPNQPQSSLFVEKLRKRREGVENVKRCPKGVWGGVGGTGLRRIGVAYRSAKGGKGEEEKGGKGKERDYLKSSRLST